ncbi:MAG: putative glycolipid-binding domain-containing protein [Chryseobacterium sp.]|jgi:hypothetical protein|uniref:putative glycolipid-binding domain-containing protein n=1 Tax=Chryseobacterium sp. TaxID=1871047 RepID=UPI00282D8B1A|nr:putative glycolipid-binding domain-containing protein [Chryseobacterium sp.]MDR2236428.1 putative glycolipid-binding domain-containing protein [Chryseobacterium sp.]
MKTTLIWKGIRYQSLEYFTIQETPEHYAVSSKITGSFKDKIYAVEYTINIDKNWNIQEFAIQSEVNSVKNTLSGKKLGNQWEINQIIRPELEGIPYIDISLTPFTNSLPINTLKLQENDSRDIHVIYIDVLHADFRPVSQRYTRTAKEKYRYENIPKNFEAEITVDEAGLVLDYPQLFEKVEIL